MTFRDEGVVATQEGALAATLLLALAGRIRISGCPDSHRAIALATLDSYQGIASAIPQAFSIRRPFRGWAATVVHLSKARRGSNHLCAGPIHLTHPPRLRIEGPRYY